MVQQSDDSLAIDTEESNTVYHAVVTFLHYAHTVDLAVLVNINNIASKQSKIIQATEKKGSANYQLCGHPPGGNHQIPIYWHDFTHAH